MSNPKPPPKFAEGTTVSVEKTQGEIRTLLMRHGATAVGLSEDTVQYRASLMFRMSGRVVRLTVVLPPLSDFRRDPRGYTRTGTAQRAAHDGEIRRRWRALLLRLKARLEVIASGDSTVDAEFLADLVLPSGKTVGEWIGPQLTAATEQGQMPRGLQLGPRGGHD